MRKGPSGSMEQATNGFLDVIKYYTSYIGIAPVNVVSSLAAIDMLIGLSNGKLDTLHVDLATTLSGQLAGLQTALGVIHTDLDTTIKVLITSTNTKLDTINTSIGATNTLVTASNVSLASIDSRLTNIDAQTLALKNLSKCELELAVRGLAVMNHATDETIVSISGAGRVIGFFHSTVGIAPGYMQAYTVRDGITLSPFLCDVVDIQTINEWGLGSVGIKDFGKSFCAVVGWTVGTHTYIIKSQGFEAEHADTCDIHVANVDPVNDASSVVLRALYYVYTASGEIIMDLNSIPSDKPDFRRLLKRFNIISSRMGYIAKKGDDILNVTPKLILSMPDETYDKHFDEIIRQVDKYGLSINKHADKKLYIPVE